MKKKYYIFVIVLILVISAGMVFMAGNGGKFVSQNPNEIEKITITHYPYDKNKLYIDVIKDKSQIEKIYNILAGTENIKKDRYPSHAESVQWDSKFIIDIDYCDGKQENIFSAERNGSICKILNNKGTSGDRGYMLGENKQIWEYVFHS